QLRQQTGSYYTPNEVVASIVRLADELLSTRLRQVGGFASSNVLTVDPAMGTGTFLLHAIRQAAHWITSEEGEGAVPAQLRSMAERLIGFERQLGPFAVAELRAFEEYRERGVDLAADALRLYVVDTLENPYVEQSRLGAGYEPIARS